MSHLPIIDVEKYFNDPSVPDGPNVGFVSPQGVVHDRFGKAIGIDSKHENAKNQDVLERLRQLVEQADKGSVAQLRKPLGMCPLGQCVADAGHLGGCSDKVAPTGYDSERNRPGGFNYIENRKIARYWAHGEALIALDTCGDVWVLDMAKSNGLRWSKAIEQTVLPPLPQGA